MNGNSSGPRIIRVERCESCGAIMRPGYSRCHRCRKWNTGQEKESDIDDSSLGSEAAKEKPFRKIVTKWDVIDEMWGDRHRGLLGVTSSSVSLIGGGPGAGKSTLSLQLLHLFAQAEVEYAYQNERAPRLPFYIATEETKPEVGERAKRLGIALDCYRIVGLDSQASLRHMLLKHKPCAIFYDSLAGATFNPQIIVETARRFKEYSEHLDAPSFLVTHATKKDEIAGTLSLQHAPDVCMTLFVAMKGSEIRELGSLKSRYGPSNYSRWLLMTPSGLVTKAIEEEGDEDE